MIGRTVLFRFEPNIERTKLKIIEKLISLFKKENSNTVPLLIIKKGTESEIIKEYNSIEEAITDLENDPNVSAKLVEKLKSSIKKLRNKTSIKIRNGEIIK